MRSTPTRPEHPVHEALWKLAQEHLDAGRRPSDDVHLTEAALEACPDELESILLLEAALDGLAETAPAPPAVPLRPAPSPIRLIPLLRPAVAAGLLATLALWSLQDAPTPATPGAPPGPVQHHELVAGRGPYTVGGLGTTTPAPAIRSFSLTVSRSRLTASPIQPSPTDLEGPARRSAIRELVATRTHSTPNRP